MEKSQLCLSRLANSFHVKTNVGVCALASIELKFLLGAFAIAWVAGSTWFTSKSLVAKVFLAILQVRRVADDCVHMVNQLMSAHD